MKDDDEKSKIVNPRCGSKDPDPDPSQNVTVTYCFCDVQMAVAGVHDPTVNRHHHYLLLTMFRWLLPVFTTQQSTAITINCCCLCLDGCCRCSQPDSQPPSPLFAVDYVQMAVAGVYDPTVNSHHHYLLLTIDY